ncbi:MAG: hypothetical protein HOV80_21845 [Polyangiaceae bacterium]|nr:hypothetical protein [Polyangiaceae bacterium]
MSAACVVSFAGVASAHDPENPDAHRSMPNQVSAGVTPLCFTHYRGEAEGLGTGPGGELDERATWCAGVSLAYAAEFGRYFDLRGRVSYEKPLSSNEGIREGLHEVRITLAADLVAYRNEDKLTITLGPEVGVLGSFITEVETDEGTFRPASGAGWTVGVVAGIRPWITYHTGVFVEIGAGASGVSTDDYELRQGYVGKLTFGWADRF